MDKFLETLGEKAVLVLPNLLAALAIFLVSLYVAGLVGKLVRRVLTKNKADVAVTTLLSQITRWSIVVFGLIAALQRFFDVTAFLAGLGILGFAVGFALQDIMQNFAAGIILLVQRPFNVGDAVEVADFTGTIQVINVRTTELTTLDGLAVIIPNASILSNPITNYTRARRRRIEIPVGVGYGSDLDLARETAIEAVKVIPGFVEDPAPAVAFDTFGDSAVNLTVYFWVDVEKAGFLDATDAAVRQIKAAFDQQGIDIPFPVRTVYMRPENA
ncbi:MAG: mechanosensitive ion channel [Chloroflexota bacterium]